MRAVAHGPHRFLVLDALRGVAALIVVAYHVPQLFGGLYFPRGYLAVDFFFMLSGFVLSFAFQPKLDRGLSTAGFLKQRLLRLYPLYLLGLTLGLLHTLLQNRADHHLSGGQIFLLYVLGGMMVPAWRVFGHAWANIVPFDPPEWSILYEMVANVIHSLTFRRRGWVFLLCVVGVSGVLFASYVLRVGEMHVGWQTEYALGPILRVTFSYFLGIAVYRVWRSGRVAIAVPAYAPILLLMICTGVPQWHRQPVVGDLATVALIFPVLLLLGAGARRMPRLDRVFTVVGAISYPVYVLHMPGSECVQPGLGPGAWTCSNAGCAVAGNRAAGVSPGAFTVRVEALRHAGAGDAGAAAGAVEVLDCLCGWNVLPRDDRYRDLDENLARGEDPAVVAGTWLCAGRAGCRRRGASGGRDSDGR